MAGEAKSVIKKTRTGVVVSDKMAKTIVVTVESTKSHPLYKKILKRSRKFMVHDEKNEAKIGDVVRFVEVRPLSKNKCWKLLKILEKAK
jgi:small subunit ribosomal protein S17